MHTSQKGIDLIKDFEGFVSDAYLCPAGVWTIGYGHTGDVEKGMSITQHQAEAVLTVDLERFERAVNRLVDVHLTQGQFDALVSFTFNLGEGNLAKSTLLRKLNEGDYAGAAEEFPKWKRAGGRVLPGLVKRRAAEQRLFLS